MEDIPRFQDNRAPSSPIEDDTTPANPPDTPSQPPVCAFKDIITHQGPLNPLHSCFKGSTYNVQILWEDGSKTWEPLNMSAKDDPISLARYGHERGLLEKPGWKLLHQYMDTPERERDQTHSTHPGEPLDDDDSTATSPDLPPLEDISLSNVTPPYQQPTPIPSPSTRDPDDTLSTIEDPPSPDNSFSPLNTQHTTGTRFSRRLQHLPPETASLATSLPPGSLSHMVNMATSAEPYYPPLAPLDTDPFTFAFSVAADITPNRGDPSTDPLPFLHLPGDHLHLVLQYSDDFLSGCTDQRGQTQIYQSPSF